jgi:hypothetical protein
VFVPRTRHFNLLIFDFSLGGIARRKHANKRGRATQFYLFNFAPRPRLLSCFRPATPQFYFLNLGPRPRGTKFYVFYFAPHPRHFNLLIDDFSFGGVAGRKHEWHKLVTSMYTCLDDTLKN